MDNNFERKIEEDRYEEEDADETLSFCDLPLRGSELDDFFEEKQSFLSSDDALFEFSGSDLSDFNYPVENILFCGKLISPKSEIRDGKPQLKSNSVNWTKRVQGKLIFPKFEISKIEGKKSKLKSNSVNWDKRVRQTGPMAQEKARWPLLMIGPASGMGASEMRSRRSSTVKGGGSERSMRREKRLWGMIKALGCGGSYLAVA